MSNSAFTPTVLTIPATGGGGTGQGELSLIENGSAVTDTSGWSGVSRVTSNSPLNPLTPTAFSISNAATAESATSGGYDAFTLPTGLQNRKLKVEFYYTTPATDIYRVSVYKGLTRVPLSTDSSGATTLPANTTGKFVAYFDTDNSASWSLNVTRTSGTTGPAYITNVIVGPGIQPQGAVVGEWVNFTPAGAAPANTTLDLAKYRRVGDSAEISVSYNLTGAANNVTWPSSAFRPAGLTFDTTKIVSYGGGDRSPVGTLNYFDSGVANLQGVLEYVIGGQNFVASYIPSTPTAGSGDKIAVTFKLPIAEWAGSGTVQLAQNDVEYASNNGNVTAAGGSDTGSFVYGPSGSPILAYNSITAGSSTYFTVQFQTPIQAGDSLTLEINRGTLDSWAAIGSAFGDQLTSQINQGTSVYGATVTPSATDRRQAVVSFGNMGRGPTNTTYAGTGAAWSGLSGANYRWRVRKSSAGAAVGFGIVSPGVSSGLVSAAGLPGNTTGNAIASGYVGQIIQTVGSSLSSQSQGAWRTGTGIVLTPGIWKVRMRGNVGTTAPTEIQGGITNSVNSSPLADSTDFATLTVVVDTGNTTRALNLRTDGIFIVAANTTYYPTIQAVSPNSTTYSMDFLITAVRIA